MAGPSDRLFASRVANQRPQASGRRQVQFTEEQHAVGLVRVERLRLVTFGEVDANERGMGRLAEGIGLDRGTRGLHRVSEAFDLCESFGERLQRVARCDAAVGERSTRSPRGLRGICP